jgi:hypothetical protein
MDEQLRDYEREIGVGDYTNVYPYLRALLAASVITYEVFQAAMKLASDSPRIAIIYTELDVPNQVIATQLLAMNDKLANHYIQEPNSAMRRTGTFSRCTHHLDNYLEGMEEDELLSNEGWGNNSRLYRFGPGEALQAFDEASIEDSGQHLTAEEIELLISCVGAVLYQGPSGAISTQFYDDVEDMEEAWSQEEAVYEPEEEEDLWA